MANFTVTPADVLPSAAAKKFYGKAIVDIECGDALYENLPYNGTYGLGDANVALPNNFFAGIAVNKARAGQDVTGVSQDPDFKHGLTGVVAGDTIILSATPGKMCPDADAATGWYKTILAIATSTTNMNLSPIRCGVIKA